MNNFSIVSQDILGDISNVGKIRMLGVRNNKYSSVIGNIVYFINKLRLKGKGIDSDINNKKGDMYVIVDVVMPSKLTKKQKDLFKELSETTLDDDSKFTKFNKMLKK